MADRQYGQSGAAQLGRTLMGAKRGVRRFEDGGMVNENPPWDGDPHPQDPPDQPVETAYAGLPWASDMPAPDDPNASGYARGGVISPQGQAWGQQQMRPPQQNPQGQQYGQAAAHMPSQANAYGMRGTMPPSPGMNQSPRQPMGRAMASGSDNMHAFADGGVVAPQPPSRLQALWQALMGRNVLQQAAGPSQAPPPPPPPEMQDTSIVRKAAEDAARRMQAEKAAQGKPQMCNGGVVR